MSRRVVLGIEGTLRPGQDSVMCGGVADAAARGSWFVTIVLIALVLSWSLLADPVLSASSWVVPATAIVTVVLVVAQAIRSLTSSQALASLGALLAAAIADTALAGPAGPLDAVAVWGRQLSALATQLASDQPPLRVTPESVFAVVVVVSVLAVATDALAFTTRWRLLALIPLTIPIVVTTAAGLPQAQWQSWVLATAVLLAFLFVTARWSRRNEDEARAAMGFTADGRGAGGLAGATVSAVAALAVAALVATLLPPPTGTFWDRISPQASLSTNRINPIIDLGDDLRRSTPVELFRYATSQTSGQLPYLSLVTLTELDAESEWGPSDAVQSRVSRAGDLDVPEGVRGPSTLSVNQNVILGSGVTPYLPHAGEVSRITELVDGDYAWDESTGDVRQVDDESLGQTYRIDTVAPAPTAGEIAATAVTVPQGMEELASVPDSAAADRIRAVIDEVVTPGSTPFEQMQELQAWFTGGEFTYSETAPVTGGYDGTSLEVIARFLETKSGYCVHFASAMATMARLLGIPARIQVGTTPGTLDSINAAGQPIYTVTSKDLHAWAELWVPSYGWVPFEATPSDGINVADLPDQDTTGNPTDTGAAETASAPPTPTGEETPTPTPSETTDPTSSTADPDSPAASAMRWDPVVVTVIAVALVVLALLAAALVVPGALRRRLRNARERRVREAPLREGDPLGPESQLPPASAAWREVADTATDYAVRIPPGLTPVQQTRTLLRAIGAEPAAAVVGAPVVEAPAVEAPVVEAPVVEAPVVEALDRLRAAIERERFAPPEYPAAERPDWGDVDTVSEAIIAAASPAVVRRAQRRPPSVMARLRRRGRRRRG